MKRSEEQLLKDERERAREIEKLKEDEHIRIEMKKKIPQEQLDKEDELTANNLWIYEIRKNYSKYKNYTKQDFVDFVQNKENYKGEFRREDKRIEKIANYLVDFRNQQEKYKNLIPQSLFSKDGSMYVQLRKNEDKDENENNSHLQQGLKK